MRGRGVWLAVMLAAVVAFAGPIGEAVQRSSHPRRNANLRVEAYGDPFASGGELLSVYLRVYNPRPDDVRVVEIATLLPPGFTYERDSTYGSTYDDPRLDPPALRWEGNFLIRSLEYFYVAFNVRAPLEPGVHRLRADVTPRREAVGVDRSAATFQTTVTAPTEMEAKPVLFGADGLSELPKLTARLTSRGKPLPGRDVRFYAKSQYEHPQYGSFICIARTNADGVASCSSAYYDFQALYANGYAAVYNPFEGPAPYLYVWSWDRGQIVEDYL